MNEPEIHCIMPPAPELEERIIRTKQRVLASATLPTVGTADVLDLRSYTLIASRPKKTRPNTFVTITRDFAPVIGVRRAIVLLVDFSDAAGARSQADINDMLFSVGTYTTGGATGSMRDFYREASYNKLDVTGQVSGAGGGVVPGSQPENLLYEWQLRLRHVPTKRAKVG